MKRKVERCRLGNRQFPQITSSTYQPPLDIRFLQPLEYKFAESNIVFDITEDGFRFGAAGAQVVPEVKSHPGGV
jgi:hypothetical protein